MAKTQNVFHPGRHSLAEDFDGITTRTEGEVDDRRVVLYKLGFEPPEEEVQVDAQVSTRTTLPLSSYGYVEAR